MGECSENEDDVAAMAVGLLDDLGGDLVEAHVLDGFGFDIAVRELDDVGDAER